MIVPALWSDGRSILVRLQDGPHIHNTPNKRERNKAAPFFLLISMAKPFARKFYSSKAWQDCRNEYAKRQAFLCENCLKRGIYRPGEIVHHKIELDPITIEKPEIALNFDNLELLCRDCHAEAHKLSGGRWAEVNKRRSEQKKSSDRYIIDADGRVTARE